MKLTKDFLRSLIIEEMNKQLNEATEEEIGHLNDVLEMPKSALPFHDIFGDRYRILSSYKSADPSSPFMQFEAFLNKTGWKFKTDNMGEVVKSITTSYIANPEEGVQQRTKEEILSLTKWMNELKNFANTIPETMKEFNKIVNDMKEYSNTTFKSESNTPTPAWQRTSGGFKREYLKDKNYLNMFRKRLALKKAIMKFLPSEHDLVIFSTIPRIDWENENYYDQVNSYFNITNLRNQIAKQEEWLMGSKGSGTKEYEILTGKNYDEYKAAFGDVEYVVFSRHPIDVFRMSDHEGLDSCHSLPSGKNQIGYDEYNICALAEAHGNGMIAYALNPDEFEDPPTQELLDEYEDGELFLDEERGVDGFAPVARIRIKNVGFLADKGDYSEIVSRVAVPEKRLYGDNIPGFKEHVNKVMSTVQKSKIQDIVEKSGDIIDLRRFLRVGGSYEDNSMTQMIPEFFGYVLERKDLEFEETVQYSKDLQQSLAEEYTGLTKESVEEMLRDLISDYNGGYVDFSNLGVVEDFDGIGTYFMNGEVRAFYPYADEIEYVKGNHDVTELMQEALDQADEIYFYDESWASDAEVTFDSSWGGYKNVIIISFNITQFESEHNDMYSPYNPETWEEALSTIKDKLGRIIDPHDDDSLNNYIKEYISYHGEPTTVRTDVSSKFYISKFKDALEEDGNWNIDDEEIDYDNPTGIEVIESFSAQYEGGIWLGDLFSSINEDFDPENTELVEMAKRFSGHLSTLLSALSSEGMNIIKAGLLYDEFYNNKNIYSALSGATKLDQLEMTVESTVAGQADISPELIFQAIIDNDELSLDIKILCRDWNAATIETVGNMMLGKMNDNNGWHIDAEKTAEVLVHADLQSSVKPKEDIQEIIRKEVLRLIRF